MGESLKTQLRDVNEMSEDECNEERITNECVYKAWVREFAPDVYEMLQVNAYEPKKKPKKPMSIAEMLDESTTSRAGKTRRVGNWNVSPIILTPKKQRRGGD